MFARHRRSSHGSRCRAARKKWRRRLRGGGVDSDDKSGIRAGEVFRMVVARVEVDAGRTLRSTAKDDDDQRRDDLWCLQAQDACLLAQLACFAFGGGLELGRSAWWRSRSGPRSSNHTTRMPAMQLIADGRSPRVLQRVIERVAGWLGQESKLYNYMHICMYVYKRRLSKSRGKRTRNGHYSPRPPLPSKGMARNVTALLCNWLVGHRNTRQRRS